MNKVPNYLQTAEGYNQILSQRIALDKKYSNPIGEILHSNIQQKQLPDALVTSDNAPNFTSFIVDSKTDQRNNEQILSNFAEMIGKYVPPSRIPFVMDSILEKVTVEQLEPIGSLGLDLFVKKNYRSVKDKITAETFVDFLVGYIQKKNKNENEDIKETDNFSAEFVDKLTAIISPFLSTFDTPLILGELKRRFKKEELALLNSEGLKTYIDRKTREELNSNIPSSPETLIFNYVRELIVRNKSSSSTSSSFTTPPKKANDSDDDSDSENDIRSPQAKSNIQLEINQLNDISTAREFFKYIKDNYSSEFQQIKTAHGNWKKKRSDFIDDKLPEYYSTVGKGFKKQKPQKKLRNNIRFMEGNGGAYEKGSRAELLPIGGKYCINMKLLADSILSLKYQKNNCHIPEFQKRTPISAGLRNTIMELIVDEKFDKNGSYSKLNKNDQIMFQTLADVLHIEVGLGDSKENLKTRFDILSGEYKAGNSAVKKDLQIVIQKCVQRKLISANTGFEMLQQL